MQKYGQWCDSIRPVVRSTDAERLRLTVACISWIEGYRDAVPQIIEAMEIFCPEWLLVGLENGMNGTRDVDAALALALYARFDYINPYWLWCGEGLPLLTPIDPEHLTGCWARQTLDASAPARLDRSGASNLPVERYRFTSDTLTIERDDNRRTYAYTLFKTGHTLEIETRGLCIAQMPNLDLLYLIFLTYSMQGMAAIRLTRIAV